jgi:hypothetical protein
MPKTMTLFRPSNSTEDEHRAIGGSDPIGVVDKSGGDPPLVRLAVLAFASTRSSGEKQKQPKNRNSV